MNGRISSTLARPRPVFRARQGRGALIGLLALGLAACDGGASLSEAGGATPISAATVTVTVPATPIITGGAAAAQPVIAAGAAGTGGDWPMYGYDGARTNYNPAETTISATNAAQLAPRWQADIGAGAGPPSGAPSVAAGRVYVASSATSGPNFFAFDAATGIVNWSADLGHGAGCFNVGIGATPAISGSVVVAGGGDSAYYGLDAATGAQLWRDPLNAGPSAFPWSSPLIVDGRAYLGVASGCDNPSVRGELRAVNAQDGSFIATQYFVPAGQAGAGIWNSPALSPDGSALVVATGEDFGGYNGPYNRAMVALDPLTLAVQGANQQGQLDQDKDYATTPIIFHDSRNRTLVAAHHKDESFYVYDLNNLAAGPIWQRQTGTIIGMMPAYDPTNGPGGTLLFIDGKGQLNAVDPATGADRWPAVMVGSARGNMAVANGLVFLNIGPGGVGVVDETTGHPVTTLQPGNAGKAYSGVVVSGGFVYWLSGEYLNAWSIPSLVTPTAGAHN